MPVAQSAPTARPVILASLSWTGADPAAAAPWRLLAATAGAWRLDHPSLGVWAINHEALPALPIGSFL